LPPRAADPLDVSVIAVSPFCACAPLGPTRPI
jgi:hypothetical protein